MNFTNDTDSANLFDVFYHAVFDGRRCVEVEIFVMHLDDAT